MMSKVPSPKADSFDAGRCCRGEDLSLELKPVDAVTDPSAARGDPLTGSDDRRMTDNGHVVAPASRLHFEHAKAVVGVMKRDPLDGAR